MGIHRVVVMGHRVSESWWCNHYEARGSALSQTIMDRNNLFSVIHRCHNSYIMSDKDDDGADMLDPPFV